MSKGKQGVPGGATVAFFLSRDLVLPGLSLLRVHLHPNILPWFPEIDRIVIAGKTDSGLNRALEMFQHQA